MSTSNSPSVAQNTSPPLQKGQIWLPGGDPNHQEAREIVEVGDEVLYILPNSEARKTKQHEPVARFVLWILRDKAEEVSTVLTRQQPEILVED